jgi:hypothetical protein
MWYYPHRHRSEFSSSPGSGGNDHNSRIGAWDTFEKSVFTRIRRSHQHSETQKRQSSCAKQQALLCAEKVFFYKSEGTMQLYGKVDEQSSHFPGKATCGNGIKRQDLNSKTES